MRDIYIMGYKVHRDIQYFAPNTVLFSNGTNNITVAMANDVLDQALSMIARKNPLTDAYNKARKVLASLKKILANKQPLRCTKQELKTTVEVLEEVMNENAKSEAEKENNARGALICKLLIDGFGGD
ncbi:MAG: hypothetical protein NC337_10600 [Roseburia sp.]|nr:hypothetical protein [Roseburia sp.]